MKLKVHFYDSPTPQSFLVSGTNELKTVFHEIDIQWARKGPHDHTYIFFMYDNEKKLGMINLNLVRYIETVEE